LVKKLYDTFCWRFKNKFHNPVISNQ
jgi:hypothetical protein